MSQANQTAAGGRHQRGGNAEEHRAIARGLRLGMKRRWSTYLADLDEPVAPEPLARRIPGPTDRDYAASAGRRAIAPLGDYRRGRPRRLGPRIQPTP